jgi:pyruvate ferredoxin oxidoreductase gamma subunit
MESSPYNAQHERCESTPAPAAVGNRGSCMFEVRFHGRGSQGVTSAAELLSVAAFSEGRHAQAFGGCGPRFTAELVSAFCRIDAKAIRLREPAIEPDALVIHDPALLDDLQMFEGLRANGCVVANSTRSEPGAGFGGSFRRFRRDGVWLFGATAVAIRHVGRPLPNTALLGALAALTGCVRLESLVAAIGSRFAPDVAQANAAAAAEAYAAVAKQRESAHA